MKHSLVSTFAMTAVLITASGMFVGCGSSVNQRSDFSGASRLQRNTGFVRAAGTMAPGGPRRGGGPGMTDTGTSSMYLNRAQDLKLSDEQVASLKSIQTAFLKDMIDKRAKLSTAQVDQRQLLTNDTSDMAAIEKSLQTTYALSAELDLAVLKERKDAEAVLTDSQKKKVQTLNRPASQNRSARGVAPQRGGGARGGEGMRNMAAGGQRGGMQRMNTRQGRGGMMEQRMQGGPRSMMAPGGMGSGMGGRQGMGGMRGMAAPDSSGAMRGMGPMGRGMGGMRGMAAPDSLGGMRGMRGMGGNRATQTPQKPAPSTK